MITRRWKLLASALALLAGIMILAGPIRSERSDPIRLLTVWPFLLAYEFLLIAGIGLLRRRGEDVSWLTAIGILFLADPFFLGDAFASTDLDFGLRFNAAAWILSMLKAFLLARAAAVRIRPAPAAWSAAALFFVHFFPSFLGAYAARPPDFEHQTWAGIALASALMIPLPRILGKLGWAAAGALLAHLVATTLVASVHFRIEFLSPPLLAAALMVPRWRWAPLAASVLASPVRKLVTGLDLLDQFGAFLVALAFALLAWGLLGRRALPPPKEPQRVAD